MDPFLRKLYVDITGDEYNAYRPREDDVEGHMYSDATILRALRALEGTEEGPKRAFMIEQMLEKGPRAGASAGVYYPYSYEAGEDLFSDLLADYQEAGREDDLLGQISAGGKAAFGILNPLSSPDKRAGATKGLLRYISEYARGE
jgi:hypothetical protein